MNKIVFVADKVTTKFGTRVDNSGVITFEIGEHEIVNALPLALIKAKNLKITVEEYRDEN